MCRRKRKMGFGIKIMLVTCIVVLNALGISYAYWSDLMQIQAKVSTGNMNVIFLDETSFEKEKGEGTISVDLSEDKTEMYLSGTISTDYDVILNYGILNNGSVPIKLGVPEITTSKGLKLVVNHSKDILEAHESSVDKNDTPKLHIKAKDPGIYEFEIKLPFSQKAN